MKGILIIVVLIVVVLLGFMLLSSNTPISDDAEVGDSMVDKDATDSDDAMMKEESVTVKMTADGFVPSIVTVSVGTKVQFVNTDTRAHWPASAVHPAHLALPGFDALKNVEPGESYWYTFEKAGEWKMHDHLNPATRGSVVVK